MSGSPSSVENTDPIACYVPAMVTTNGMWQGDNPLDYALPLFVLQLTLAILTTRILIFILRPLHQPRVFAEILAGFIVGPSILGASNNLSYRLFPLRSVIVLETMAYVGIQYFVFLVGVEMDISVIKRRGKKAIAIAIGSMILPFVIGCGFGFFALGNENLASGAQQATYILFVGLTLTVTTFSVMAHLLSGLNLSNTEIGRLAMSCAIISETSSWILLALSIALSRTSNNHLIFLWVILSNVAFVVFCYFIIRPIIIWMIRRTPEGEAISDFETCLILTSVMIVGFVTDIIGTHFVIGAFVFGLIIPNGPLTITIMEKLEDIVSGFLLPLFFLLNGIKTNIHEMPDFNNWMNLMIIIVLAYIGKFSGTVAISHFYNVPLREAITMGLLMNTKGVVELIILNIGRDKKVLDNGTFSLMVIVVFVTTGIIGPLMSFICRPTRGLVVHKQRTLQSIKQDSELGILFCIHTPTNVPSMIKLLEVTHPTRRSPLCVYVLHLIELTGRASAMLIVHNTQKSATYSTTVNQANAQSYSIFNAFENYQQLEPGCVTIQPLTAISPYSSMHEDICKLAEDKLVSFIILPFHKHQTVDGGMKSINPIFQTINQNILANAPCSVGILVDRGIDCSFTRSDVTQQVPHYVVMLFLGGPDDRDGLAYAWRMSHHLDKFVTVLRFLPGPNLSRTNYMVHPAEELDNPKMLTEMTDIEHERQLDEEYLNEFREKTTGNKSITYMEKLVNNGDEIVTAIRSISNIQDLYIVGRGQGMISPLTIGLVDWCECPELGALGHLLAYSDFAASAAVLVVQQHVGLGVI